MSFHELHLPSAEVSCDPMGLLLGSTQISQGSQPNLEGHLQSGPCLQGSGSDQAIVTFEAGE